MTPREICLKVHRWSGLFIAFFLVVAGLTGSALAYQHELEAVLLPGWFEVTPQGQPLPVGELALVAERLEPRARVSRIHLPRAPDQSLRLWLEPRPGASAGHPLSFDEAFVDPYTGRVLGKRLMGKIAFDASHLLPMLYRLHYSLLLGDVGVKLFGIVGLIWVLNCFLGGFLTLPMRAFHFLKAWRRTWIIRPARSIWRLSFDLHRAAGLWLWGVLLVFALSAVQFNLNAQVFLPVLSALMPVEDPKATLPRLANGDRRLTIDWAQALERGRALMAERSRREGFAIEQETHLLARYDRQTYIYAVRSSLDISEKGGQTEVYLSAEDGRELAFHHPEVAVGNAVSAWLSNLHMGFVGGRPYQAFVALMGGMVAALSITGVMVWVKRRSKG